MSKTIASENDKLAASPYYGAVSPYGDFGQSGEIDENGFSLFELIGLLRRRWEIVLSAIVIGTCAASAYGVTRPDIYQATASLLIEPDNKIVELDSVVEGVSSDAAAIETQINLLKSRGFLESYIKETHSTELEKMRAESELDKLKSFAGTPNKLGGAHAATVSIVPDEVYDEDAFTFQRLGGIVNGLSVAQQGRSYIINVTYASEEPSRAQDIANGIAEHYIAEQTGRRRQLTGDASDFLEERLEELKQELVSAEQAIQAYRAENALSSEGNNNMNSEQLANLMTLVIQARADRKEKETRISFIEQLRRKGSNLGSLTEVLSSPYMATLWEEESVLRNREAELVLDYGANHPKIQTLATERQELNERIDLEIDRIIANTRNELEVLIEREKSLNTDVSELSGVAKDDAASIDQASIKLRILEGEAEASRRMFQEFLIRLKETREQEGVVQANTRLVAKAQLPGSPTGRGPMVFGLLGFVASSALGFGLAFLRERNDRGLRSSKQITKALKLPCLGQVPYMDEGKRKGKKLHEYLAAKPVSAYAESIRSIYTKLSMQDGQEHTKVIQIISSLPAEGKTTFAVSLATLLKLDGKSALLIDLDLRHPSVGREIPGVKESQPFDEFLRGEGGFLPTMVYRSDKCCDVIGVKNAVNDPASLMRSKRLKFLIKHFRKLYEYIIIDSAPSLGLSDSKEIMKYVDTMLFVVKWNKTDVDDAVDAVEELNACNAKIGGVVLSQVKVTEQKRYGYKGIDQYYGKNEKYYKN